MSKESKDAEWNDLAQKHEFLFGKKPRKNMKLETLQKKIDKEIEKRDATEDTEEDTAINDAINAKLSELVDLARDAAKEDGKPVMLALVSTKRGIHMSMIGEGQDAAIMVATSMASQPMINAVVTNAAMMAQMRRQQEASMAKASAPLKEEEGLEGLPTPQTEA